jgi:hypothetical protein
MVKIRSSAAAMIANRTNGTCFSTRRKINAGFNDCPFTFAHEAGRLAESSMPPCDQTVLQTQDRLLSNMWIKAVPQENSESRLSRQIHPRKGTYLQTSLLLSPDFGLTGEETFR